MLVVSIFLAAVLFLFVPFKGFAHRIPVLDLVLGVSSNFNNLVTLRAYGTNRENQTYFLFLVHARMMAQLRCQRPVVSNSNCTTNRGSQLRDYGLVARMKKWRRKTPAPFCSKRLTAVRGTAWRGSSEWFHRGSCTRHRLHPTDSSARTIAATLQFVDGR